MFSNCLRILFASSCQPTGRLKVSSFQVVFEFCSLQVASQPGDCKCVFKLSSNSVTLNLVRFKLPANRESDSVFSSCLRTQSS